ncbi:hypothetical protein P8452_35557 [Trifolium repens]|nr:hypothetical protein P8452_35557 [Trifolium repens]
MLLDSFVKRVSFTLWFCIQAFGATLSFPRLILDNLWPYRTPLMAYEYVVLCCGARGWLRNSGLNLLMLLWCFASTIWYSCRDSYVSSM